MKGRVVSRELRVCSNLYDRSYSLYTGHAISKIWPHSARKSISRFGISRLHEMYICSDLVQYNQRSKISICQKKVAVANTKREILEMLIKQYRNHWRSPSFLFSDNETQTGESSK